MSLVRICWFGLVLALSTQWLPAAAQASAFPLFARNSFCTTLYDEPLKRLERVFVENKTPRKEQDAERASLNRKVLELLSIIDATPPDKLGAHKRLGSESLVEDFGNDFDGGLMVALIQCFAQEKERLATVLVQNIGGVELELRGSDEPTCYTV